MAAYLTVENKQQCNTFNCCARFTFDRRERLRFRITKTI